MYDATYVQREKCALYSLVCHSVLTKVCFIFLCMAMEYTCATRHNPPDTGVTIITPMTNLSTALPSKLTAISGNRHKYF